MQRIETALELTSREEVADTSTTEDEDFDRSHIIGKSKALEACAGNGEEGFPNKCFGARNR